MLLTLVTENAPICEYKRSKLLFGINDREKYNQNKNYYQLTTDIWLAVGSTVIAMGL
jgi:hypothetical protein